MYTCTPTVVITAIVNEVNYTEAGLSPAVTKTVMIVSFYTEAVFADFYKHCATNPLSTSNFEDLFLLSRGGVVLCLWCG